MNKLDQISVETPLGTVIYKGRIVELKEDRRAAEVNSLETGVTSYVPTGECTITVKIQGCSRKATEGRA